MPFDIEKYRKKVKGNNPHFNMIPFIDILFTLLIFLVITSSFHAADEGVSSSGKPEVNQGSGPSEYYLIPVAGLKKVTVNGIDKSEYIRNSAIAVHKRVIDEGEIIIRPREGLIIIKTPPGFPVDEAVRSPS